MSTVWLAGTGGLGALIGARVARAGHDVVCPVRTTARATALHEMGLRERGLPAAPCVAFTYDALAHAPRPDVVILAVPPDAVVATWQAFRAHLAESTPVVCVCNGLPEVALLSAGASCVLGAVVSFGASRGAEGSYATSRGGRFKLGAAAPDAAVHCPAVARVLQAAAPVKQTQNLAGARWAKLAVNSAVSTLGCLGGASLRDVLRAPGGAWLAMRLIHEAASVAQAQRVVVPRAGGVLSWHAATRNPRGVQARLLTAVLSSGWGNMRSSVLAAYEKAGMARVDALNGAVVTEGQRAGVPTPVQRAVWLAAQALSPAKRPSLERLEQLALMCGMP